MIDPSTVPFLMVSSVGTQQINKTRLVEAVITAAVSGGMIAMAGYYVAFPVLQEQVAQIRRDVLRVEQGIRETKEELDIRRRARDESQAKLEARILALQIEMARRK